MRIAGGEFRGRNLLVPAGVEVRPTQDRVREALFNMLQGCVAGASFLDLFAGSGAVGLEALSRGAASVTMVELSPRHVSCIERNVAALNAGSRARVVRADAYAWLPTEACDIAFADPPYDLAAEKGYGGLLAALARGNAVKAGGLFVAEMRYRQDPEPAAGWEIVRDRVYGQTRLAVYRRVT